ncbi:MAG: PAS domain S-box protein [Thermodesulfobacteriota bacterium]|nr:PAS domain S-box protein [Thermodesulfobacteriota bacterium]
MARSHISSHPKAIKIGKGIYQSFVEKANDGVFVYQDHHFCYVNPEFKRALGYQTSELLCMGLKDIVRAGMRDIIEQRYEKRIRGEDVPQRYEVVFITKDSIERIFSLSPSVIKFNNRAATLNIARDITERVHIQQQLEASNRFVTSLINNSSDAIIATDMEGKILIFNDAAEKITGYKAEDLLNTKISIRDFMGPGEQKRILALLNKGSARAPSRIIGEETTLHGLDGSLIPISLSVSYIYKDDKPVATISIFRDLRPIREVEERLRESEQKYRILVEKANDGIFVYQDHMFKYTNPRFRELLDYSQDEIFKMGLKDLVRPELKDEIEDRYERRIHGEKVPEHYEISFFGKDKKWRDFEITPAVIEYEGKIATQNIIRDITERKLAERALQISEARYRTTVEHTGTAMMIFEDDYTISLANHQAELLTGYSRQEMEGKMLWPDIVFEEDIGRMKLYHKARRQMDKGTPSEYEFRLVDKFGRIKDAFITIGVIPGTKSSVASIMDITQRKRMEEELAQTKKLAMLGEMSAHVAHEVRNPLQQIKTGVDFFSMAGELDQRQKKILNGIMSGIKNLESFVTQILEWTKSGKVRLRRHSINNIINGLVFNYEDQFKAQDIKVEASFTKDVDKITIDGIQLRQAMEDIIDNAMDAMPDGGILKIATQYLPRYPFKGEMGYNKESFTADALEIRIKDTGRGIPKKDLGRVFQPFFTTKTRGTGLGLALAQKVVSIHHGEIEAKSDGKNGAEFIIRVPISQGERK